MVIEIASFSIKYQQYLNEHGEITQELPSFAKNPENLIELYQMMVLLRALDTKGIALQRTGKMGTYASILGQEAISIAIGRTMRSDDVFVPFYRDYGAMLQRGVKMSEIYTYWGGDERGSCYANNQEDLPMSVPIGTQGLHAAGIATAFKLREQPRVAVTTCGDGATSEGDFYEALNIAGTWKLPVVFVINNNQWAISVPLSKQTSCQTLAQKAIAGGFEGIQIDGNDIIACNEIISNAIEKARKGGGPTLIEAVTYRLSDHTTADDATRYRSKQEVEEALQKEPIRRLKIYLQNLGVWNEEKEKKLQEESQQKVNEAVNEYMNRGKPPLSSIFDYHFEQTPKHLNEQKQQALEDEKNA